MLAEAMVATVWHHPQWNGKCHSVRKKSFFQKGMGKKISLEMQTETMTCCLGTGAPFKIPWRLEHLEIWKYQKILTWKPSLGCKWDSDPQQPTKVTTKWFKDDRRNLCFWEAATEPRSKRYICGQSLKGGLGGLQTSLSQTGSVRRNGPDFQQTITHL